MREEIEKKIKELEWKSEVKSILMIDWLKQLLTKLPEENKEEEKEEVVKVEVKDEKPLKRKINFRWKKWWNATYEFRICFKRSR